MKKVIFSLIIIISTGGFHNMGAVVTPKDVPDTAEQIVKQLDSLGQKTYQLKKVSKQIIDIYEK